MTTHTSIQKVTYTSIRKVTVQKVTASALIFILSLVILPYYTEGDQGVYREVYKYLPEFDLLDGFIFYTLNLSSSELTHFLLAWLASPYLNHDMFIAIFNVVFAYAVLSLFQKWGASFPISVTILFTNYYLLVLYFPAERLKFGFLFLALSLINTNSKKFFIFLFFAFISHIQTIIFYICLFFSYLVKTLRSKKLPKLIFVLPLILAIPLYLMSDQLLLKFLAYASAGGIEGLWKLAVFFLLSIYYSKDKVETTSLFLPLFFAVFLLGGERVNLFGYFLFLYYGLQFKGGRNYGVAITSVYYAYASLILIANIIQYGTGFIV
tara:strand:+ start:353 stop:1318 length:966 start_codon:yes stop_codon:yes gene_type:complete